MALLTPLHDYHTLLKISKAKCCQIEKSRQSEKLLSVDKVKLKAVAVVRFHWLIPHSSEKQEQVTYFTKNRVKCTFLPVCACIFLLIIRIRNSVISVCSFAHLLCIHTVFEEYFVIPFFFYLLTCTVRLHPFTKIPVRND